MSVAVKDTAQATAKKSVQKTRVYVLLNVAGDHSGRVASVLRRKPGVVMVDILEEQPSVIMVVEAQHRLSLAELTIQALTSVESLIDRVHLMPIEDQRMPRLCRQSAP